MYYAAILYCIVTLFIFIVMATLAFIKFFEEGEREEGIAVSRFALLAPLWPITIMLVFLWLIIGAPRKG